LRLFKFITNFSLSFFIFRTEALAGKGDWHFTWSEYSVRGYPLVIEF
jgi:cellulose synthase/poly-beta-1,6-N-acetylglucosamine synthase-like glycosyltransferase